MRDDGHLSEKGRQISVAQARLATNKAIVRQPHWHRVVIVMLRAFDALTPVLDRIGDYVCPLLGAPIILFKHLGPG